MNFFGSKQKKKTTPMILFSEFSASREKKGRPERKREIHPFLLPGVLWMMFFCILGYFLFFSRETEVRDISFVGNETIPSATIEMTVLGTVSGKYFSIFPRNNFFLLPKDALIQNMEDISPKIKSVTIRRIFPSGMEIGIEERPVVILWRSASGDFLLNEDGTVSHHPNLPLVSGESFSFLVHDEGGRDAAVDDTVTEAGTVSFIGDFVQKFESRFGKTLSHEVWVPSRFSGELSFHAEEGFDILLDSHFKADDILTTLQAAMERGIVEEDRQRLSRIDLRTENRVYYTLKEIATEESAPLEEAKQPEKKPAEKKKK